MAASEFQGTAFLAYDEQFLCQSANNLRISWDQVDIELCTVTFSGLAKPHCLVCSSPHHSQSSCPSTNRFCQSSKNSPVCFRFNRSSGCNSHSCPSQHVFRCVPAVSPKPAVALTDPPTWAIAARDKVQPQTRNLDPPVFRMMMQMVLGLLPTLYTHPWTVLLSATPRMACVPSLTFFWAWGDTCFAPISGGLSLMATSPSLDFNADFYKKRIWL